MLLPALVAAAVLAAAEPRSFELDDVARLVQLSEPRLSPDGRRVALVVGRANLDENRYDNALVVVEVGSRAQRTLVPARPGLASPRWDAKGERLAFLADAEGAQVFVVPAAGGEPRQVTRATTGVDAFAFSPDGARIAYVAPDPAPERQGAARFEDGFVVGHDSYLTMSAPRPSHLYLADVDGGIARRVTSGTFSLSTGLGATALDVAPDGRTALVTRFDTPHSGDADRSRMAIVELASGSLRDLTGRARFESGGAFSPDASQVAFLHPRDADPAAVTEAWVAPVAGGAGMSLTAALDRNLLWLQWRPDGQSLLVSANDETRVGLWQQPLAGPARRVDLGSVIELGEVSQSKSGAFVFVGTEDARPDELYVVERLGQAPRRLTSFGDEVAALRLGKSERLAWRSEDGFDVDGAITLPPGHDPAQGPLPLVLLIHGGPTGASSTAFSPLAQLFAARGFLVLQPNYRGSDNLGDRVLRGIVPSAGEGPGRDVIAGVDALVARGLADPKRLAVSGWSYGGFMTGWMIGRYPDRFRAAVAGAAALDLFDMYALSDLNVMPRHFITGSPWKGDAEERFRAESPLRFFAQVRTPTLILSSARDSRVAVTQSYKLFRALEDNGVETRFVAYPTSGHWPAGPVRRRDIYRRWIDWIAPRLK
jgi:dipeptidyl aminopeptidase/acylaminoacyl peptidase